jgi:hypothetical protein
LGECTLDGFIFTEIQSFDQFFNRRLRLVKFLLSANNYLLSSFESITLLGEVAVLLKSLFVHMTELFQNDVEPVQFAKKLNISNVIQFLAQYRHASQMLLPEEHPVHGYATVLLPSFAREDFSW